MPNILLVEDQVLTQMGIKMALEKTNSDFVINAIANNVAEAIAQLQNNADIDFVLLDIQLPDGSGIEVMEYIQSLEKDIKVLVLSVDTSTQTIMQLCELGISGFISKYSDIQTIEEAIVSVANGNEYFGKDINKIIQDILTSQNQDNDLLTARELQVIRLCAKGYSASQIAEELFISTRTVETHKNNIFKKLGFSRTTELIKYALDKGIIKL